MRKTQAAWVLASALIALSLGCDSHRITSPSAGGDRLSTTGTSESHDERGEHRSIGLGITVLLVHGAFVDASGWQDVIPILQHDGFNVIAVQNPLSSLANDVATTRRLLEAQHGPVVVVGHSYGGAVITGAAAGNPNVRALVYIAAYAPDVGEPIGALNARFPQTGLGTALIPDAAGFLYTDPAKFRSLFAADLPERQTRILAVTQKPLFAGAFGEVLDQAAWHTIPSWFLVAKEDQAINPDLERFMANRMGAHTSEIRSSHVPFVSHPNKVADLIEEAAVPSKGDDHD